MGRVAIANDIINRAGLEVGLVPASDPYNSSDQSYTQLTGLLTAAGQELVELHNWQTLIRPFDLTTQAGDSGTYALPADFSSMIDQTGWDRTNRVSIGGPLSAQDWAYLKGRDLVSQSIYASFRLLDNKFDLFPQPPPENLQISFEYISRNWVQQQTDPVEYTDTITGGNDIVLYEPILIVKFLKVKFLESKGLPSDAARMEFENMFVSRTAKDEGAPILNAARGVRGVPYLNSYYNTPDTGYGVS